MSYTALDLGNEGLVLVEVADSTAVTASGSIPEGIRDIDGLIEDMELVLRKLHGIGDSLKPDELEFGLSFGVTAEGGLKWLAKGSVEATIEVSMKWTPGA